jgi:uncharacterized protein (TIGR03435 family)
MRSGFSGGRYELRNASMVDLIQTAWSVDADNVAGGPEWLDTDRYDVIATAPAGSSQETLRAMLRALLADRFHLAVHTGTRNLPAFAIVPAKKPQLKAATNSEETGCQLQPSPNPARRGPREPLVFACRNMTMATFANQLPSLPGASGYLLNYRVVDQTGLNSAWDFSIKYSPNAGVPAQAAGNAITLSDAFENQLGLRLKFTKVPAPVAVVDRVDEKPSGNPPEATETLPTRPMEFEVADIKPAGPGVRGSFVSAQPSGQVRVNMTLKGLIQEAWGDLNPARIIGGPKSMDGTQWVVVAKAPRTGLAGSGIMDGVDINTMRMMLRALLADRFKLEAHQEERLVDGYALVAAKPKLRKADPSNRPGCKEGPGAEAAKPNWKDPRIKNPVASRLVTCRNMTLAEFATAMSKWRAEEGPIVFNFPPVVDATAIQGRYDMTLNFSPPTPDQIRQLRGGPAPVQNIGGRDSLGRASDPDGTISIFEALDKQLGLKLKSRKVMGTVLVIDHVDERPTEN